MDDGVTDCCNFDNNKHRCCCPKYNHIEMIAGKKVCVPDKPQSQCPFYGIIPGREQIITDCMNNKSMLPLDKHLCYLKNIDPVVAYATVLHETGADGVDFDFESPDPAGKLSIALVKFAKDLKAYMAKKYNKKIYFSITPLSGDSYRDQYVGIYESLQSSDCPFDYAIPMLYNGGQYPYGVQVGEDFTWNGLLS